MKWILPSLAILCLAAATPAQYCTDATHTTGGCGSDEYISNVTIDTLNNPSVCLGLPWYSDYTSVTPPNLGVGIAYPISVTVSQFWGPDQVRVWCDWDGNFSFLDAGEEFILTTTGSPSCTGACTEVFTGTITPPPGAMATTTMRVRLRYSAVPTPCTPGAYGETEDYTINTYVPDFVAAPNTVGSVGQGAIAQFTLTMSALTPPSPPIVTSATVDLTAIGGSATEQLFDDGINGGDAFAGDNIFTLDYLVPISAPVGTYLLPFSAIDSIARTANGAFTITVTPGNDECVNAIPVALGANGPFSNAGATDSAGMVASCQASTHKDVFFTFTPACTANYTFNTVNPAITPVLDTVLQVYDVCGGVELACDDDGGPGLDSMIASINLTGGVPYIIRVASFSTTLTGSFSLNVGLVGGGIAWSSPLGAGSIQWDLTGGPSFGTYFHAIWFFPGNYPNGWFLGIDIPIPEIINQVNAGFPFVGGLDACGANTLGPFAGLPSGFTVYSTALFMTGPGLSGAASTTAPATHTIP